MSEHHLLDQHNQHQRVNWSSKFAYLMTIAGTTIGFGATWRFPYLVGQNGGGAYVLVFALCMILIGIPMLLVENVIGRRVQRNVMDCFSGTANGKPVHKAWQILGWSSLAGVSFLIAYYMVLGGWVAQYIFAIATNELNLSHEVTREATTNFYNTHIENSPWSIAIATFVFLVLNWIILAKGIIQGIEKAAKYLMPIFFICMIIMIVRNLTLPNSFEGVKWYLTTSFAAITPKLFIAALGQVFLALSLGLGVIITLSSYLSKEENLVSTSIITCILNTIIAVLAGFMIFPSIFSFGLAPDAGPSLVFKTLPIVFSKMTLGPVFGIVFFLLLGVAAITSSIPLYEAIITWLQERTNLGRQKSIVITLLVLFVVGNLPSVWSSTIFNFFDNWSANFLFVITAFGSCLYIGFVLKDEAKNELLLNNSKPVVNIWYYYAKFILPILIGVVFVFGLPSLLNF